MKRILISSSIFHFLLLLSCGNNNEKIEGYHSNEILVVTLAMEKPEEIEKVILEVGIYRDTVNIHNNQKVVKLKAPQKGEGVFVLCVHKRENTICSSENYIEGGYRPKMVFKENKFEFKRFF